MFSKIRQLTFLVIPFIIISCGKKESPTQENNTSVLEANYTASSNSLEQKGVILGCYAEELNKDIQCGIDQETFENHISYLQEEGLFDTEAQQKEYFTSVINLLKEYHTQTNLFIKHCDELHYSDCHTTNFNNITAYIYFQNLKVEILDFISFLENYIDSM